MTGLILTCLMGVVYWLWRKYYCKSNEPPTYSGELPLIGHAHTIMLKDACVVTDPDDAMLVANTCLGKSYYYSFAKPWVGEGLVTAKVSIWKNHRKLLNSAFNQSVLDGFLGVFNKQARRLVEDLASEVGKGPFDHSHAMRNNGLETICLTALGVDFTDNTLLNSEYVQASEDAMNTFVYRFQNIFLHNDWIYNWTRSKRRLDECIKVLHAMADKVLQIRVIIQEIGINLHFQDSDYVRNLTLTLTWVVEMKKNVITEEKKIGKFKPFLDLLLELKAEKGVLTDEEIREEVDTMIVAGHDTSASSLIFTLVTIGSYPEVQEKLYKELKEVIGESDRDVEKEDLRLLVYTEAVIKETIRVYPIGPLIIRHIEQDVKLKNCTLSAGSDCIIFLNGINRHPMWGPDAHEFRPERWLEASVPDHPAAFAAFSLGKRQCIGKSYALMSMKTVLVHLLRHYRFQADHTMMKLKYDVMLKSVSGHHISIERRS